MTDNELVKALRDMLPPQVDYAKLVCAEGFAHGQYYVWTEPEPYIICDAATRIEQLAKENVSQQCKILMLTAEVEELRDTATRLQAEYDRLRNEHCNLCGRYKMAHEGACDGCRWRKG